MATAFYGTIVIRNLDGTLQVDRFDSADVSAGFATFKSTGGATHIDVVNGGHIVDIVLNITAAGTTKDFKLHLNQRSTNIRWVQACNFPTVDHRFPNVTCPIPVTKGSRIQLEVIT